MVVIAVWHYYIFMGIINSNEFSALEMFYRCSLWKSGTEKSWYNTCNLYQSIAHLSVVVGSNWANRCLDVCLCPFCWTFWDTLFEVRSPPRKKAKSQTLHSPWVLLPGRSEVTWRWMLINCESYVYETSGIFRGNEQGCIWALALQEFPRGEKSHLI